MHAKIDCTFSVRAFSFKNITLKCFRAFSFFEFCQIFHRGHFPLYEGHFPLGHFPFRAFSVLPVRPNQFGNTPIGLAASRGHLEVMKVLINSTKDPNVAGNDGWTPIHSAADKGYIEIVKLLMSTTDNPNAQSNDGSTPLLYSAMNGHLEVVKLLMSSCDIDNPNFPDNDGTTPILYAVQGGHLEVVKLLISSTNVDPNETMMDGLHFIQRPREAILKW